ncbi:MAG: diacylglycerol/polyprenol kinase family protein [Candidatus Thorarchaeota archaeon]
MQVEFTIVFEDIVVFFIAVIYALIILTIADVSRRKLNLHSDYSRKIIHLFAGAAVWTVPYYPHPWVATFVALLFVLMLGLANTDRFGRFFAAMARPEDLDHGSVRGPFWYAVSITVLTAIFTFTGNAGIYYIAGGAIMIMMLGDGMSAPIGMKYGANHTKVIFGSNRSIQGCIALFVFGFLGVLIAFWWFGIFSLATPIFTPGVGYVNMILLAFIGAITATVVELISPKGTDNITLPMISCIVMFLVAMQMGLLGI